MSKQDHYNDDQDEEELITKIGKALLEFPIWPAKILTKPFLKMLESDTKDDDHEDLLENKRPGGIP